MRRDLGAGLTIIDSPAPVADAQALRIEAGLSATTEEQARLAIEGTWAGCHVVSEDLRRAVAMGRVIGDGGWYFHVVDMATLPHFQGRGLGGAILDHLLAEIRDRAPANAYVNLLADPPGRRLYASRGFIATDPDQIGMSMRIEWARTGDAGE